MEYNGQTYRAGQTIVATLDAFHTLQLQDSKRRDLTGSLISADKDIAVFSGNLKTGNLHS